MILRFFRLVALILIVLGPLGNEPVAADDVAASQVFKNHEAAVGYSLSDGKMKPYILRSTTSWSDYWSGTHQETSVRLQAGALFREDITYHDVSLSLGFDGTDFWRSSPNDNISADGDYSRTYDVTQAIIDPQEFDASLSPELRPSKDGDEVIRIHPKGGISADVYFNRSNWMIDETVMDPDSNGLRTEYSQYRSFGPAMFPTLLRAFVPTDLLSKDQVITTRITTVEWAADITAEQLSAPSSSSYASFPASGQVTLPFDPKHHVVVSASVNGTKGRFLIDTQTDGIYVDDRFANTSGLRPNPNFRFDADSPDVVAMPAATIDIGGLQLRNVKVGVFNFSTDFDGIMGLDVLSKAVTSIDFDAGTITFTDPTRFTAPSAMYALPITLDQQGAEADAVVNGTSVRSCELALAADVDFETLASGPAVRNVRLGPFSGNVDAGMTNYAEYDPARSRAQCVIGFEMLGSFNMVIDYPAFTWYLAPAKVAR